jgi:hypothetical protein
MAAMARVRMMFKFFNFLKHDPSAPLLAFWLEWLSIAVVALIDIVLASQIGMRFHLDLHDANLLAVPLILVAIPASKLCARRVAVALEFFALMLATVPVMAVATYIALARSGLFWDDQFLRVDRALGFDWLGWFHFVTAHRAIAHILEILYYSPGVQAVYFTLLMGLMGAIDRMREIFWILFLSLVLISLASWLMPAMGPFEVFSLKSHGSFLPEMARVHSRQAVEFSLTELQGIVTFPSFHTTLALAMIYGFRRTSLIGWALALANGALLLGVPVFGGHYLVDMIAGAVVFAICLAAARIGMHASRRKTELGMALATA